MSIRVGFTGTQRGMTEAQLRVVTEYLRNREGELHHGDCIGADAQVHDIARDLGWRIIVHPPIDKRKRAFCAGNMIRATKQYLERNRDIVNVTDHLLAAPYEAEEQLRSGTWSTVRYARTLKRRIYIFLPDGQVKCEALDLFIVREPRSTLSGARDD